MKHLKYFESANEVIIYRKLNQKEIEEYLINLKVKKYNL